MVVHPVLRLERRAEEEMYEAPHIWKVAWADWRCLVWVEKVVWEVLR
jgi:hypothetical protein